MIVDHLTPPMTTADTYGVLAQLGELVDEYYQVEMLDPSKLPLLQAQIWGLVKEARLDRDLGAILGEHHHEGDDEHEGGEHAQGEQDHGHEHEHEGMRRASLFVLAPEEVHGLVLAPGRGAGGAQGQITSMLMGTMANTATTVTMTTAMITITARACSLA